ncbi:MAG: DUF1648 domain-containing protein [Pseudomonadota bacterium]
MRPGYPFLLSFLIAALSIVVSLSVFSQLPDTVAVHWNINGEPDGFASKIIAMFLLPALMLILPALYLITCRFDLRKENLHRSLNAVVATSTVTAIVLAIAHGTILANALGISVNVPRVAMGCVGALLLVTGNYMGKTRSNFVIGIRNRWTLFNERVWDRTHRVAGWLFVADGLCALLVSAFGRGNAYEGIWLITLFAFTVILIQIFSYVAWKKENQN